MTHLRVLVYKDENRVLLLSSWAPGETDVSIKYRNAWGSCCEEDQVHDALIKILGPDRFGILNLLDFRNVTSIYIVYFLQSPSESGMSPVINHTYAFAAKLRRSKSEIKTIDTFTAAQAGFATK